MLSITEVDDYGEKISPGDMLLFEPRLAAA